MSADLFARPNRGVPMCFDVYMRQIEDQSILQSDFSFYDLRQAMRYHRCGNVFRFLRSCARRILKFETALSAYEVEFLQVVKSRKWITMAETRIDHDQARKDTAARLLHTLFAIARKLPRQERGIILSYYILTLDKNKKNAIN